MSGTRTRQELDRLVRPLRGWTSLAWTAFGAGLVALILGGAALLTRWPGLAGPAWVFVAWAAGLAAFSLVAFLALRALAGLRAPWLARRLEQQGEWRAGGLRAFLDPPAPGTSTTLYAAADAVSGEALSARGPVFLAPERRTFRQRAWGGLLVGAVGLSVFAAAGPVHGPAAALWRPGLAWEAITAPVSLSAAAEVVDREDSVALLLRATGRREAVLWVRGPGEPWRARTVALDSTGRATELVGPLRTDLFARLSAGPRSSDTVHVRVRVPAFLGSLTVTAHYPRYLALADEPMPVDGDTLLLPAGTRLDIRGEATAPLSIAAWTGPSDEVMDVRGSTFSGALTPRASGTWALALTTKAGAPLAGDPVRLPVRVIPDAVPRVEIPVPGRDTTVPLSLRVPLVVEAQDDYGLSAVVLESRRISRLGLADDPVRQPVTLPGSTPDRALLTVDLDLNGRGLLPGDTVRYFVRAVDNAPSGQAGQSREYVLRLPTLSEVRAAAREATRDVSAGLDSALARSRELQRQTEDLSRERPRQAEGRQGGRDGDRAMSYDQAQRAEAVAREQQKLQEQAGQLQAALEELQQSAKAAGLNDPEFQRRLEEIREQLDRALSPELRQRLADLQQALKELDPERAREALEQLAKAQQGLRDAIERSRELFRRAAVEGDMANLAAESRELAREQEQWSDQVARADSARAAAEERALAARADSLAAALERLAPQVESEGQSESLEQMSDQASQAAEQMQQAASQAQQGQRSAARQSGQQAAQMLQPLGDQLQQARQQMQQQWRDEVTAQLDRALSETTRLAERELDVTESFRKGDVSGEARAAQGALEEGVQKLLDQVRSAGGKNALVSPEVTVALTVAQQKMQQAREAVGNATPDPRGAAEAAGQAVDALNAAAYQLVRAKGEVAGAGSGSGLQEAMEKMQQMAGQQGGLNQQASGLFPMAGNAGVQAQLQALGRQQRRLAEQLERMRAEGQLPGTGELAEEARDLARQLEEGRIDRATLERQERLFRRMLDAGRTLQGEERDDQKERQSTTGRDDNVRLPPALRALLQDADRAIRVPDWETMQRLSPEERRLVVEYFRRLSDRESP